MVLIICDGGTTINNCIHLFRYYLGLYDMRYHTESHNDSLLDLILC
jgi:hypothetical protein